jgi:hypothetical protein
MENSQRKCHVTDNGSGEDRNLDWEVFKSYSGACNFDWGNITQTEEVSQRTV